jgi:hypothetical protein
LTDLVKQSSLGQFVFLLNFLSSKPSNEDRSSVPDDLKNLSWGDFRDIDLKISVTIVSGPSIESADDSNCIESGKVGHGCVIDCAQHVDLGPSDIGLVLIVHSVLVEPVVKVGLEVDVISEVAGTGGGDKELGFVGHGVVVIQLLGGALIILTDEAKVEDGAFVSGEVLRESWATCLTFDKNNILFNKYIQKSQLFIPHHNHSLIE